MFKSSFSRCRAEQRHTARHRLTIARSLQRITDNEEVQRYTPQHGSRLHPNDCSRCLAAGGARRARLQRRSAQPAMRGLMLSTKGWLSMSGCCESACGFQVVTAQPCMPAVITTPGAGLGCACTHHLVSLKQLSSSLRMTDHSDCQKESRRGAAPAPTWHATSGDDRQGKHRRQAAGAPVKGRHRRPCADGAGGRVVPRRRAVLAAKVDQAQVQRVPVRLPQRRQSWPVPLNIRHRSLQSLLLITAQPPCVWLTWQATPPRKLLACSPKPSGTEVCATAFPDRSSATLYVADMAGNTTLRSAF